MGAGGGAPPMGGGGPPMGMGGGGMPPMGMGGMAGIPNMGLGGVESEEIKIPDRMVGLIIGRGGESISRLQTESGAKIQMSPQSMDGSVERTCTLTGSRAAIERAKELIDAIVASRANERDRDRVGMGGGGGGLSDMMGEQPGQSTSEMMVPSSKVGLIIGEHTATLVVGELGRCALGHGQLSMSVVSKMMFRVWTCYCVVSSGHVSG